MKSALKSLLLLLLLIVSTTIITVSCFEKDCTVTFRDHDGKVIQTVTVKEKTAAEAPADPTREGYNFVGWDKDVSNVTEDVTVTAAYEINSYEVKFVDFDGRIIKYVYLICFDKQ